MKINAIQIREHGGPDVLTWTETELPEPAAGEVRIRHTAIGLNYIDVYHRTGLYPVGDLPAIPGLEAAGVVEAVGPGVERLKTGDRIAYASPPLGAYCEARNIDAARVVKVPAGIGDRQAAAVLLQGMTAEYLLCRTFAVKRGDILLFHAAAGGVGLIACRWAKHLGATVIGTVGSEAKAELAKAHGCDHVILYRKENVPERVKALTDGRGVDVVYDSVGKDTIDASLDCLKPRGMLVSFGQSSGPIPPMDLGILAKKGSLFITRPTLMTYTAANEELYASAGALFAAVDQGVVKTEIRQTFPLKDAAEAHRSLESRATIGSTILLP